MDEAVTADLAAQARSAGLLDDVTAASSQRLLIAGVDLFSTIGFHATTTRDIAQHAGMSPAALYIRYRSKGELLSAIIASSHRRVVLELETALAEAEEGPRARFAALVRAFVRWHAEHTAVARITVQHLAVVDEAYFPEIRALRNRIVELFETEVVNGISAGVFAVDDVHHVTLAVLSLGLDLTRWYSPTRPRTPEQMAALYTELALRMMSPPAPAG